MLSDFADLGDEPNLDFDVCIVGAGAAGITLARRFIGSSTRVGLLESGGLVLEEEIQGLYDGDSVGFGDFPAAEYAVDLARLRFFGGSTNHWGGWSTRLTRLDLGERPWASVPGWPLEPGELDSYYQRAEKVLQLAHRPYDEHLWPELAIGPPAFDPARLATRFWQGNPLRFGAAYRSELEQASNVQVVLHANVAELVPTPEANAIDHLEIRTLDGRRSRVTASIFVLACGGIENARLLLLSDRVTRRGLGNDHDLVGRFFMEHPHALCGTIWTDRPEALKAFTQWHRPDDVAPPVLAALCPSDEVQRSEGILNCSITIESRSLESGPGIEALQELRYAWQRREIPTELEHKIWIILKDLDDVLSALYRRFRGAKLTGLGLYARSEQAPDPESRVTLLDRRDALGQRKVRLDWRLTELERRTIRVVATGVAAELGRLGLGRTRLDDWLAVEDDAWEPRRELPFVYGIGHHLGTTRMADDPKRGVVDPDCRVHGIRNLYVAGSSVFPSGGYANPTLTIVALALRLGDHLTDALRRDLVELRAR